MNYEKFIKEIQVEDPARAIKLLLDQALLHVDIEQRRGNLPIIWWREHPLMNDKTVWKTSISRLEGRKMEDMSQDALYSAGMALLMLWFRREMRAGDFDNSEQVEDDIGDLPF